MEQEKVIRFKDAPKIIKELKWRVYVLQEEILEEKDSRKRFNLKCELDDCKKELYDTFGLIEGIDYNKDN